MQRSDFTMSDFYASWVQAETILSKLVNKGCGVELASLILDHMHRRKSSLLDNPAMLCAIILDPRFCCELKGDQKKLAIDTTLNLWRKMKASIESRLPSNEESIHEESSEEDISIHSTTMLRQYMEKKKANDQKKASQTVCTVFEITDEIESFIACQHDVPDGGIYDFWQKNRYTFPGLYKLAEIIYAISPTQAIVERAFSTLSHVFSSKRNQLGEDLLDDILTIALNEQLFYVVNDEEIDAVSNKFGTT